MTPQHFCSAETLIRQMQSGELTSEALVTAMLDRIREHNPALNAVVTLVDENDALEQARTADRRRDRGEELGALHGLPLTLKDTWEVTGMTCTAGAPALARHRPRQDAELVRRLRAAGAIIIGKTNVPLFASDLQTYNKVFGVSNNPYDPERTPGGSSGGSAAALAAGLTPLEVGSDLAGSVRTPAHFCGVAGHKPSRSLVSFRGHIPGPPGTLAQPDLAEAGPMARNARDLELLLNVIAGPRPDMARSWKLAMEPAAIDDLASARVGLWLEDPHCPVEQELTEGYRRLAASLGQEGAEVASARHELLSMERIMPIYLKLLGSLLSAGLTPAQKRQLQLLELPGKPLQRVIPMTVGMEGYAQGVNLTMAQWLRVNEAREKMRDQIESLFREFDVLLTPVNPVVAIRHNHRGPQYRRRIRVNGRSRPYMDQFCWIALATLLGLPATTVPVGRTRDGLPYNIQIIGAPGRDLTTLKFAQLLEEKGLAGFQAPEGY